MNRPLWRGVLVAPWLLGVLPATALTPGREPAPALATACPGPDALGYICQDSGRALTVGDTDIGNHCDDCTTAISLPFPFTFYGTTYTTANVSSNGNL
jgi:hypothetical protein